jgi:hypothetical protein
VKDPLRKDDASKIFFARSWLLNCEKSIALVVCGKRWFKQMVLHLCSKVVFLSIQEVFLNLVDKTKYTYLSKLVHEIYAILSFNLWMSKGTHDKFAFVISFFENLNI